MSEFSKEQLTLALGHHVGQKVIGSDRELDKRELAVLHRLFPREGMEAAGFVDAKGRFTPRFEEAARMAMSVLPGLLDDAAKRALMGQWYELAMADDEFERSEDVVLHRAGEVLGYEAEAVDALLLELAQG